MSDPVFGDAELEFPVDVQFRIIAEDIPGIKFVIETVLFEMGIEQSLRFGQFSANAKYISFSVDIRVLSREMLNKIDFELRNVQGVRMVL